MAKRIPQFQNDDAAAEFWDTHDSAEYADEMEVVLDLRPFVPPTEQACLGLPSAQLESLKRLAEKQGLTYQALLRRWIAERLAQETVEDKAA